MTKNRRADRVMQKCENEIKLIFVKKKFEITKNHKSNFFIIIEKCW